MLSALSDPMHERHAEFVERHGHDFDPKTVETDELEQVVAALARRMTRPKASCINNRFNQVGRGCKV